MLSLYKSLKCLCLLFIYKWNPILGNSNVPYHGPFSSCQKDTPWAKGSGPLLRSWWRSIVPLLPDSPADIFATPKGLVATFTKSYTKEFVREIISETSNITWRIHGRGKYDGWLYGPSVEREFTGDNIAYIYQDMTTAILGKFEKGLLIDGKAVLIKGHRCKNGIMELQFTKPRKASPSYKFERMNETFITSQMTLMDPHDKRYVFVRNSSLQNLTNGDGLFAKRYIPPNFLVALYAGYFKDVNATIFYDNMTIDEREEAHKNLMSYNDTHNLDLPPHLTSIVTYRATLGHKVNNAFGANRSTEFCYVLHPRFGHCRCIRSLRGIAKGEEIFIDYGYDVTEDSAPRWYRALHNESFGSIANEDETNEDSYSSDYESFDGGRE